MKNGRCGHLLRAAVFLWAMLLSSAAWADDSSYVLALSWQPAFCASTAGTDRAECADGASDKLTLHGLWPNADRNDDGRIDAEDDYCLGDDRARLIALDRRDWRSLPPVKLSADLTGRLTEVMPGVHSQLERHQWVKHGSCSGLAPERYFATATDLTQDMQASEFAALIETRAGMEVARRDVLQAFSAEFGKGSERALQLLCRKDDGVAALTEMRIRLKAATIEAPLSARSFDTSRAAKGSCPARFRVVGD